MKEKFNLTDTNLWISFGGSYPGSLAAWLREKFPHLIHGSVSVSGPLLAKINFIEYYQVVVDSLGTYNKADCVLPVQKAIQQIEILMRHMVGQRSITEQFQLCDPIENSMANPLDIASLFESIASDFAGVVQYNKDNRDNNNISIDEVCDLMCNQTIGAPVTRLAAVNRLLLEENKQECLDYKYDKMLEQMKNTSWDAEVANGMRQWTYQTCTEFGFYQTSDKKTSVFGDKFPTEFFTRQCADIYGDRFSDIALKRGVERSNIMYGALKPATTKKVLYVHGSIDPWHALGLIATNDDQPEPTVYIQGTAHCASMYEPRENDLPQLKAAREEITNFIEALIK